MFMEALSVSDSSLISLRTAELRVGMNSTKSSTRITAACMQGGTHRLSTSLARRHNPAQAFNTNTKLGTTTGLQAPTVYSLTTLVEVA